MLSSLSYSAFAAACFSASVSGLVDPASARCRISNCRARSNALDRSTSRGRGALRGGGDVERDVVRSRRGGPCCRGDGEREIDDRVAGTSASGASPGSGVGIRTADCIIVAIAAIASSPEYIWSRCRPEKTQRSLVCRTSQEKLS